VNMMQLDVRNSQRQTINNLQLFLKNQESIKDLRKIVET